MAKYTVEERDILEEKAGYDHEAGFSEIDDVLNKSWDKIFTTDCEFFDEDYREPLCKKILKHFYLREIGAETAGLWQFWMNRTLEEQMPYFNQMYKSTLLKYPIFTNMDIATKNTRENTGETTNDQTGQEGQTSERTLNSNRDTVNDGNTHDTDEYSEDTTQHTEGNKKGTSDTYEQGEDYKETENEGREENENGKTGSLTESTAKQVTTGETETGTSTETDISAGEKHTDNVHWDLYSDTPQGGLQNIVDNDGKDADIQYLTNFRKTTDNTDETVSNTDNKQGITESNKAGTSSETGTEQQSTQEQGYSDTGKENYTEEQGENWKETEQETSEKYDEDSEGHKEGQDEKNGTTHNEETSGYIETEGSGYDKNSVYNALGTSHDLEEFAEHTFGKSGSDTYAEMLMKFRDTFLNLDMELIGKFEENFMQLW